MSQNVGYLDTKGFSSQHESSQLLSTLSQGSSGYGSSQGNFVGSQPTVQSSHLPRGPGEMKDERERREMEKAIRYISQSLTKLLTMSRGRTEGEKMLKFALSASGAENTSQFGEKVEEALWDRFDAQKLRKASVGSREESQSIPQYQDSLHSLRYSRLTQSTKTEHLSGDFSSEDEGEGEDSGNLGDDEFAICDTVPPSLERESQFEEDRDDALFSQDFEDEDAGYSDARPSFSTPHSLSIHGYSKCTEDDVFSQDEDDGIPPTIVPFSSDVHLYDQYGRTSNDSRSLSIPPQSVSIRGSRTCTDDVFSQDEDEEIPPAVVPSSTSEGYHRLTIDRNLDDVFSQESIFDENDVERPDLHEEPRCILESEERNILEREGMDVPEDDVFSQDSEYGSGDESGSGLEDEMERSTVTVDTVGRDLPSSYEADGVFSQDSQEDESDIGVVPSSDAAAIATKFDMDYKDTSSMRSIDDCFSQDEDEDCQPLAKRGRVSVEMLLSNLSSTL